MTEIPLFTFLPSSIPTLTLILTHPQKLSISLKHSVTPPSTPWIPTQTPPPPYIPFNALYVVAADDEQVEGLVLLE